MKKICFVVSEPMTARAFLRDHIRVLADHYHVTLVANFSAHDLAQSLPGVSALKTVPIRRSIRPFWDLYSLFVLYLFFRGANFSAVHSVTPKAGLLAMLASRLAGVEHRFHTFTGQVWVGRRGPLKWLLAQLDKLLFYCASYVLVDSPSQRAFLIDQRVITDAGSDVLGDGSICGVDVHRFSPSASSRELVRTELGLPNDAFIFLFLGRVNREKGLGELVHAFSRIGYKKCNGYLLVVGPDEDGILNSNDDVISALGTHFVRRGFTTQPQSFMAAADVFCLPSYREGFGSVIIEAAASGVPSIGSDIYGVNDAIEDGVTGILHKGRDIRDLAAKMTILMADREMTINLGRAARLRACKLFTMERIVGELLKFYIAKVGS